MLKKLFIFLFVFGTLFYSVNLARASSIAITNISTNINTESNIINFNWMINNAGLGVNVGLGTETKTVAGKVNYGLSANNLSETKSYVSEYPSVTLAVTPSITMTDGQTYYYQITANGDNNELILSDILSFVYHAPVANPFSLVTPAGGETYTTGDKINVSWTSKIASDKITAIFIEGVDSYGYTLNSVTPPVNSTSYSWSIPSNANGAVKLKLRTSYYDLNNRSQQFEVTSPQFTVGQNASIKIQSPQAGASIKLGENIQVKYTYENPVSTNFQPNFSLYKGGKLLLDNIYVSGADNFWVIDSKIITGNDYQIKVKVGSNESLSPNFTITVPESINVAVTSPKKADIVAIGSSHAINWNSDCKGGIASVWFSTLPDKNGDTLLFPLTSFSNSFAFSGQNALHEFYNAFDFNSAMTTNSGQLNWRVPSFLNITNTSFNTGETAAYYFVRKSDGKFVVVEQVINPTVIETGEMDYIIRVEIKGNNCVASGVSEPFKVVKTAANNPITPTSTSTPSVYVPSTTTTTPAVVTDTTSNKETTASGVKIDQNLVKRLSGQIVLQVESHGEAYYINPKDGKGYYMADGSAAYDIMRNLGIGITNKDLDKIKTDADFRKKYIGKIFLQVESRGEAYYISANGRYNYLKDGAAAYEVMRSLGLGITNIDLNKISVKK